MATEPYLITGRKGTGVHDHLDIEDLQASQPQQFTLFVLAFLALQGRGDAFEGLDIPPAARFYELAAIHGLPFTEWIGDHTSSRADYDPKDPKDSQPYPSRFGGYCSHGSVAFPTWHRPCIMSIEQAIGDVAVQLAERLSANSSPEEAAQWKDAAHALRFPFWDWAAEKVATNGVPKVITDEKVSVTMPGGTVKEVENPLAYYPFDSIPDGFRDEVYDVKAYFSQWKRTFRYVQSTTQPDGNGNASMNAEIKKRAAFIRQGAGRLFTYDDKGKPALVWDEFSNHTTQSLRKEDYYNISSLEGVHDGLHGFIGGNGHMSFPDYAGFDPVFFLHHCNVDRLFALWEYVYPQYYMGEGYPSDGDTIPFTQSLGTYNLVYNAILDGKTALAPYRTGSSKYWTSDETRFLDGKYYSYPEVAGVKIGRDITDEQRVEARKSLQKYYGVHDDVQSLAGPESRVQGIKLPMFNSATAMMADHDLVPDYRNFVVVVQTNEFAFNGSYTVDLYFVNGAAQAREADDTYVGTVAVFARSNHSDCQGCQGRRAAGSTVRGVIPIPFAIIDQVVSGAALDRASASTADVADALKARLRAAVVDHSGVAVGRTVGDAEGGVEEEGGGVAEADALARGAAPELTLVSSAAALARAGGALAWCDWAAHGRVFGGGAWARVG